jgi:hypothetical protein
MSLFDPNPYTLHPGLWPSLGDVVSDDEAAELVWPGSTFGAAAPVPSMDVPLSWGQAGEAVQSWR